MATELAQGYLSLSMQLDEPGKALGRFFAKSQQQATAAGRDIGKSLSDGIDIGAAKTQVMLNRLEVDMRAAGKAAKDAASKQEDAARKVAIAEAKLQELRASGKAKASQLLAAEDRVASSRKAQAKASLDAVSAQRKAQDASADYTKALREQQQATQKTERGLRGVMASMSKRIPSPFKRVTAEAGREGRQAGKRFGDGVTDEAKKTSKRMSGLFTSGLAGGIGGAAVNMAAGALSGVSAKLGESITLASDLNETVNKAQTIFGANYTAMDKWASGATKALGLTKSEALAASSGFGDMFLQLGFAGTQATKMSQQVVQMAADLGSFSNMETGEVADMLSAAFRGEYDSLQRLIPNINAARVETEALRMTGKKTAKQLTAQEKAAATLAIVQKDGARATGDFAKTSGEVANKSKIVAARQRELATRAGQALLPLKSLALDGLGKLLDIAERLAPVLSRMSGRVKQAWAEFSNGDGAKRASGWLDKARQAAGRLADWFRTQLWPAARDVFGALGGFMRTAARIAREFATGMMQRIRPLIPQIKQVFAQIGPIVIGALGLVKAIIQRATQVISFIWRKFGGYLMNVLGAAFKGLLGILRPALAGIRAAIAFWTNLLNGNWRAAWGNMKSYFANVWRAIIAALKGAFGVIKAVLQPALDDIKAKATTVMNAVKGVFTSAWTAITGAFRTGVDGVKRIWAGIEEAAKKPVRFVIGTVINDGLIGGFNKVAGVFNAKGVDPIKLPAGFARGGILPGRSRYRDGDDQLVPMRRGEGVTVSEAMLDPYERRRLLLLNKWALSGRNIAQFRRMHDSRFDGHAGGGIVSFRGHRFTSEFARRLLLAERMAGQSMHISQGGFRPRTPWSGSSHAGDAVDITGGNFRAFIMPLRTLGIPTWDRTGRGNWQPHAHGIPLPFAGRAGGSGITQAQSYLRGGDGLGGRDYHPRPELGATSNIRWAGGDNFDGHAGGVLDTIKAGVKGLVVDFASIFARPLSRLKDVGDHPFAQVAAGTARAVASTIKDKASGLFGLSFNSSGDPEAARGFLNGGTSRGEWAALSEDGRPELVVGPQQRWLQKGSRVYSFDDTAAMLGGQAAPLRIISGSLSIDEDGTAWIEGIAQEVYDQNRSTERRVAYA